MFTLNVHTDNESFLNYLTNESSPVDNFNIEQSYHSFMFSSIEKASEIVSTFVLYYLKEKNIELLIKERIVPSEAKHDFSTFVSNSDIFALLQPIKELLFVYFQDHETLNFEGFISFRLKKENDEVYSVLNEQSVYYTDPSSQSENFLSLKSILSEQEGSKTSLEMFVQEDGDVCIRSKDEILLEENMMNEDTVLSHIILLSPEELRVFDPCHLLTKEGVILLKQLFHEKVNFFHEPHHQN